jgi:Holliday junction resolvasome RuvABC endonuclease subunit
MNKEGRYFVGIDPSLVGTGIVMIEEDGNIVEKKLISTTPDIPTEQRLLDILKGVSFIKTVPRLAKVYMEDLAYFSKSSRLFELAGLHFLIRTYFFETNIQIKIIPPKSLKKFVTNNGNAKKNLMLLKCYKRWGESFEDDNICDAYCLARLALEEFKDESKQQIRSDGA